MSPKPKGGKRPGAGRPPGTPNPGTLSKEQARDALRAIVIRDMDALVSAQLANAKGLKYLVARNAKTGKFERVTPEMLESASDELQERIEVWEKDPSVQAFTDLMNRALDKPKEQEQDVNAKVAIVMKWGGSQDSGA